MRLITSFIFIFGLYLFVSTKFSYGYIDPGSGSYLFQMIIGGVLGALFLLKLYWRKLIDFFHKKKDTSDTTS
jgi:hypothetical protein